MTGIRWRKPRPLGRGSRHTKNVIPQRDKLFAKVQRLAERTARERLVAAGYAVIRDGKLEYTEAGQRWRDRTEDWLDMTDVPLVLTQKK